MVQNHFKVFIDTTFWEYVVSMLDALFFATSQKTSTDDVKPISDSGFLIQFLGW